MPVAQSPNNEVVSRDFDYKNFIFKQNGHDIRNQYEKLRRIPTFHQKIASLKIRPVGDLIEKFSKKYLRGSTGRILREAIF